MHRGSASVELIQKPYDWQTCLASRGAGRQSVELNHDIALRFDWRSINPCRLIASFANGIDDGRKEIRGAKQRVYALHAAIFGDSRFDANGIPG